MPLEHLPAAIVLVASLLADPHAAASASEIIGSPDAALLERAAHLGLRDAGLAARASELARLALLTGERLSTDVLSPSDLDAAREFFHRYTLRARAPADDLRDSLAA